MEQKIKQPNAQTPEQRIANLEKRLENMTKLLESVSKLAKPLN